MDIKRIWGTINMISTSTVISTVKAFTVLNSILL